MVDDVKFTDFCYVLEDIKNNVDQGYKRKTLQHFYDSLRIKSKHANFYPILRLLLPSYDRSRSYGMKEDALRRSIIKMLCLPKNSEDSKKLSNAHNFSMSAYNVLRKYYSEGKNLSVKEINDALDAIAAKNNASDVMTNLFKRTSPFEQKWIISIILKQLGLSLGHKKVLNLFHPDAESLFEKTNDLEHVCITLNDKSVHLNEIEITLFSAFCPMLSKRCDVKEFFKAVSDDKLMYVENKFDGERFQLHMKDGAFKYFSRRGFDFTKTFGQSYTTGIYTPLLKNAFSGDTNSILLDGEMMGYDLVKKQFSSKGMNFDVKHLTDTSYHQPCFCVFDILFLNDKVLTQEPLSARKKMLEAVMKPIEGVILISEVQEVHGKKQIIDALNDSATKKEEGIVFKNPDSVYVTNSRNDGWWKMKLEYFADVMTDLDVIVMGGFYGKDQKIDKVVVGIAVPSKRGTRPTVFHSLATIHTGLTNAEWDTLNNGVKQHLIKTTDNKHESFGLFFGKRKPDVWIKPESSCILEVRASELIKASKESSEHKASYTLRFGRIQKLHFDKPYYDCLTTDELEALTISNLPVEKLFKRRLEMEDLEYDLKKTKKIRTKYTVNNIVVDKTISNILEGHEFCVWSGDDHYSKEDVEKIIQENGGTISKVESQRTYCILVGNEHQRVKYYKGNIDIVKLPWILCMVKQRNFSKYTPLDMIYTTSQTKNDFMENFDKFGDSYTKEISKDELKSIVQGINDSKVSIIRPLSTEIEQLHKEIQVDMHLSLFNGDVAYFDKYEIINDQSSRVIYKSMLDELEFKFWGGEVSAILEEGTTNLVITNANDERCSKITSIYSGRIVTQDFIKETIAKYLESKE